MGAGDYNTSRYDSVIVGVISHNSAYVDMHCTWPWKLRITYSVFLLIYILSSVLVMALGVLVLLEVPCLTPVKDQISFLIPSRCPSQSHLSESELI